MTRKQKTEVAVFWSFRLMAAAVVGILAWILGFLIIKGAGVVSWEFFTEMPSDGMTSGGILPAIVGTLCLTVGSIIFAFPIGVMSGIYTTEYAPNNFVVKFIRVMTNNLSGIPSIIFGLFGMTLFVNTLGFGDSILAGSLTLGLLALPIVMTAGIADSDKDNRRGVESNTRHVSQRQQGFGRNQTADDTQGDTPYGHAQHSYGADTCRRPGVGRNGTDTLYRGGVLPSLAPDVNI